MRWCLVALWLILACKVSQSGKDDHHFEVFTPDFTKGPPTVVYKTKRDYSQRVPVSLSDDRSVIVSYPGKTDIGDKGQFPIPSSLSKGYLLDNRGINKNVAFLKYTYAEYASLDKIPSKEELYKMIVDADPLIELCDCGSQKAFVDLHGQLNQLIRDKELRKLCRVVK